MNAKERVLRAVNRKTPDRVPMGYAGANGVIDAKMKQHFRLAPNDENGLMAALGVDLRYVGMPDYTGPRLHPEVPGRNVCPEWGIRIRWVTNEYGGYWDYCDFPMKDADHDAARAWPMPNPDHYDYDGFRKQIARSQEYAVVLGGAGIADAMNWTGMLRGTEMTYMDLVTDGPGLILARRKAAIQMAILERVLRESSGLIDVLWMGEDLGTQQGPLISMTTYREILRPIHQQFVDLGKKYRIPIMVHSCGSSSWVYDDFIEMGITIVDTLQPEAANMSPAYLKQRYGNKLAFHGCLSTAGPLAAGSVEEVRDVVKTTLDVMKPHGGYIMAPTHSLQDNTPLENVLAAYETCRTYGVY